MTHPNNQSPMRIQRKRTKGWHMPPNTVNVTRPGPYGNPFTLANSGAVPPVLRFACEVAPLLGVSRLRGKNLACFCRLCPKHEAGKPLGVICDDCAACHGDVLLDLANPKAATFHQTNSEPLIAPK